MAIKCTICEKRPDRQAIDAELQTRSLRQVAERFKVPLTVLWRHKQHAGQAIAAAAATAKSAGFDDLVAEVRKVTKRLSRIKAGAERVSSRNAQELAFKASRELRHWLALQAKLEGWKTPASTPKDGSEEHVSLRQLTVEEADLICERWLRQRGRAMLPVTVAHSQAIESVSAESHVAREVHKSARQEIVR